MFSLLFKKPSIQPNDKVFKIVWPILYSLMAISFFKILKTRNKKKKTAITMFLTQLILNLAWPKIFFKHKKYKLAYIEIYFMLVASIMTTVEFYKKDKLSSYMLLPYVFWLTFATLLNGFYTKSIFKECINKI